MSRIKSTAIWRCDINGISGRNGTTYSMTFIYSRVTYISAPPFLGRPGVRFAWRKGGRPGVRQNLSRREAQNFVSTFYCIFMWQFFLIIGGNLGVFSLLLHFYKIIFYMGKNNLWVLSQKGSSSSFKLSTRSRLDLQLDNYKILIHVFHGPYFCLGCPCVKYWRYRS